MISTNQIRATGVSSNKTVWRAEEVAELHGVDGNDDSAGTDLILNSGSTHHMVWNRLLLTEFDSNNNADRLNLGRAEC